MARVRKCQSPIVNKTVIPFHDAEQVWFWYVHAERARREGVPSSSVFSSETRPCDPDDVYRCVMSLRKRNKLQDEHLNVLAKYGWRDAPPDPRIKNEERPAVLWDEAIDKLYTVFIAKGIIKVHEKYHSH